MSAVRVRANTSSIARSSRRNHRFCFSTSERRRGEVGDLGHYDWQLDADHEPPLGAHILSPRCGYVHHGIYIGEDKVVHYDGLAYGLRRRPVVESALADFAAGHAVWIRSQSLPRFSREEVVCRARSRIGEDRYQLFTNNCEHFCEWCLRGEPRSYQVEELFSHPQYVLWKLVSFAVQLLPQQLFKLRIGRVALEHSAGMTRKALWQELGLLH